MSGHQTATIDDTVYFYFAANDTSGSAGDGATPLFDVREAGAAAGAAPLLSGTPTLLTSASYPAGCHEVAVAATTGNGFAANDTFGVFSTLAIDSQNPVGFIGSCTLTPLAKAGTITSLDELDTAQDLEHAITQSLINALAASPGVGAAPFIPTITLTAGTNPSGTSDDLANDDGNLYTADDDAGNLTLDLDYEMGVGVTGIQFLLVVGSQGNGDDFTYQIYDQIGATFDDFGTISGGNVLSFETFDSVVISKYTTNTGLMQVRIIGTGLGSATLSVDKAVAYGISATGGIANGSTITLTAAENNKNFIGHNWNLVLGTQDIGGSYFAGSKSVTGTATCANGAGYKFDDCDLVNPTLTSEGKIKNCTITALTFTSSALAVADDIKILGSFSGVEGSGQPSMDWSAVTKTTSIETRGWHGGGNWTFNSFCTASIEVFNGGGHTVTANGADVELRGTIRDIILNVTGGETIQIIGVTGGLTINGNTTGSAAAVTIQGVADGVTNNTTGLGVNVTNPAVTLDNINIEADTALSDMFTSSAQLVDDVWDEALTNMTHNVANSAGKRLRELASLIITADTAQGAGTGNNQIQLAAGASSVDGAYDPAIVSIVDGTGAGQTRLVLQYEGSTRTATIDRDWKVNPDNSSEYVVAGDAGREHTNEGLAQAGTATSITLNALASSGDAVLPGQVCYIRSGTGADQAEVITSYNGTTKVADVEGWAITPDSTSGYVILPLKVFTLQQIIDNTGFATEAKQDIMQTAVDTKASQTSVNAISLVVPTSATDQITQFSTTDGLIGAKPTAAENRTEMDSNSTQLNTTLPAIIDDLAIKKNTAGLLHIEIVLSSDHVTPATGLTVTAQRLIDSGTYAAVAGTMTEISNGTYRFDYLAADSNGDLITWRFSAATADDTKVTFKTVT